MATPPTLCRIDVHFAFRETEVVELELEILTALPIEALKEHMHALFGVPLDGMVLVLGGKALADDTVLTRDALEAAVGSTRCENLLSIRMLLLSPLDDANAGPRRSAGPEPAAPPAASSAEQVAAAGSASGVAMLVDMGFSESEAAAAVAAVGGDVTAATNYIIAMREGQMATPQLQCSFATTGLPRRP
ncbi:uncharacterized protein AMSG_06946 [Thecamonas trahens ATCC 50062]|uniref:UBA domain-containing protein n=1 Tax=Thecamonas trahens ATCC 50062 TaxID=461836 RepID=A0A0L0DFB9_THETB|nr:hypothetical protein AMSG_06946 [Thecamonas trahens ATCC 50062]KNC50979.1 hypothetical protein AMSG_06946 [Thecamonas trahens ATCC 50062]|eukprot:XP_013756450.1 hypothetical protein AMSG_06946 [Thecamonas trahens ATCC 50062]